MCTTFTSVGGKCIPMHISTLVKLLGSDALSLCAMSLAILYSHLN